MLLRVVLVVWLVPQPCVRPGHIQTCNSLAFAAACLYPGLPPLCLSLQAMVDSVHAGPHLHWDHLGCHKTMPFSLSWPRGRICPPLDASAFLATRMYVSTFACKHPQTQRARCLLSVVLINALTAHSCDR